MTGQTWALVSEDEGGWTYAIAIEGGYLVRHVSQGGAVSLATVETGHVEGWPRYRRDTRGDKLRAFKRICALLVPLVIDGINEPGPEGDPAVFERLKPLLDRAVAAVGGLDGVLAALGGQAMPSDEEIADILRSVREQCFESRAEHDAEQAEPAAEPEAPADVSADLEIGPEAPACVSAEPEPEPSATPTRRARTARARRAARCAAEVV